jgi:hypothetical protein
VPERQFGLGRPLTSRWVIRKPLIRQSRPDHTEVNCALASVTRTAAEWGYN